MGTNINRNGFNQREILTKKIKQNKEPEQQAAAQSSDKQKEKEIKVQKEIKKFDIDGYELIGKYNQELLNKNLDLVIGKALRNGDLSALHKGNLKATYTATDKTKEPVEDGQDSTNGTGNITLEEFLAKLEGDEFDKEVDAEEAEAVIKELTDLLKADLKSKYNFSDEFLDAIVEFAKKEIIADIISEGDPEQYFGKVNAYNKIIAAGNNYWNEYYKDSNLKTMLNSIIKDIEALTGETVYWKRRMGDGTDTGWKEEEWIQTDIYLKKSCWSNVFIQQSNTYNVTSTPDDPFLIQNDFLSNLYREILYKLGCSDYDDQQEFYQKVLNNIAEKIGVDVEKMTPMDIMTKLNAHGNNCWLDGLYDCINEVFEDTYIPNYTEAKTIDADIMMGNNNSIDAKFISDNLANFAYANDAGTRKFNDFIYKALQKYHIYNDYDEIEMINTIIKRINVLYAPENTENPPKLTKETLEKLNENDIFEILDEILASEELRNEYYFGSIDGEIGYYGQQGTGDCGLLAGINALRITTEGQNIFKNCIKYDNVNDVYLVTLPGVGKTYPVKSSEIIDAINDSYYADGDRDVYLIERAMELLMYDIWEGKVEVPEGTIPKRDPDEYDDCKSYMLFGVWPSWLTYAMTGFVSESTNINGSEHLYDNLENLYNEFKNENIGITLTLSYTPKEGDRVGWDGGKLIKAEDGSDVEFCNGHAYTIVDITIAEPSDPEKNTVTIVNPWYPDRKCTITWAEFAEIGVSWLEILNITNVKIPKVIKNMDKHVDKWFEQLINGEISSRELYNKMIVNCFSEEKENYIFNKWLLLCTEGYIENKDWPYPPTLNRSSSTTNYYSEIDGKYGMKVEINGSTFIAAIGEKNGLKSYFSEEIFEHTTDTNIINQYFDIVGTKDGEPYIYRLKEGMSIEEFMLAAASPEEEFIEEVSNPEEELIEEVSNPEEEFILLFTGMSNPLHSKEDEYYNMFIYNFDNIDSFNMTEIEVNDRGYYSSSDRTSQGLFGNLVSTVKTLINSIPGGKECLDNIGGEDRLKQILMNIWNDFADGSVIEIRTLFDYIFDDVFGNYSEILSYM